MQINIAGNELTTIPEEIAEIKLLQFLDIPYNPISEQEKEKILELFVHTNVTL